MRDDRIKEIIDECINIYIDNIARELEDSHDRFMDDFGFPMFGETSKDYHEQVYFQSYLEAYTRTMINAILQGLSEEMHVYDLIWPEFDSFGIYRGYTNKEYETEFGFEIINPDLKIGYKYIPVYYPEEIEQLLSHHDVEKIYIVEWDTFDHIRFRSKDKRVQFISPKELLGHIWGKLDDLIEMHDEVLCRTYESFIKKVTDAVSQANAMISLMTLPGFTSSYLFKNKEIYVEGLVSEINNLTKFQVNDEKYKKTERDSEQLISHYGLSRIFLERNMEKAFVGVSPFAKSFLTSEYLFRHFGKNEIFDYTPIVSGYLKSVEQIVKMICENYRNMLGIQQDMSRYTMHQYIEFIEKNDQIFCSEVRSAKQLIKDCLLASVSDRNNLFHTYYCDNWDKVKAIRLNTFFLYAVLFGGVELSVLERDQRKLGIVNDDYNKLFELLNNQNEGYYTIIIDGKEYSGMQKESRREGLSFNKKGIILNKIVFRKLEYDEWKSLSIAHYKIPTEIWLTDSFGKKIERIW